MYYLRNGCTLAFLSPSPALKLKLNFIYTLHTTNSRFTSNFFQIRNRIVVSCEEYFGSQPCVFYSLLKT